MSLPARLREGLRRHPLWLAMAAAGVPLAVLLGFQYRWLVELDRNSAVAWQASLDNYLAAVSEQVELAYRSRGERLLNLPPTVFEAGRRDEAARHFQAREMAGARRLFLVSFLDGAGEVWFYDPGSGSAEARPGTPEARAVAVAVAPWQALAAAGGRVERPALAVDERDPEQRVLLNPILDDRSGLVGVAGMILDEEDFRARQLGAVIDDALPRYFGEDARQYLVVTVRDGAGRTVLATADRSADLAYPAERAFSFVFTDWSIALGCHSATTPAQWARFSFFVHLGLSGLLAALVTGGVALALRTAAREVRLSRMKSDFVSNVSHELRTPLASIRVFAELLRLGRADRPEQAREYGRYIETESRRLTGLIDNLLDFARIESERKEYRFESADLLAVVAETLGSFEVRLRQQGFRLSCQTPERPLPPVRLDPAAFAQALANLLDNAVKYSGEGREIGVEVRREGDRALVAVRDRGIGIPPEEQAKIFERFHRAGSALVHEVRGSGLGLAIVRHVMEAHGGRVTVASRPGRGSTFTLELPLAAASADPAAAPARPPLAARPEVSQA